MSLTLIITSSKNNDNIWLEDTESSINKPGGTEIFKILTPTAARDTFKSDELTVLTIGLVLLHAGQWGAAQILQNKINKVILCIIAEGIFKRFWTRIKIKNLNLNVKHYS